MYQYVANVQSELNRKKEGKHSKTPVTLKSTLTTASKTGMIACKAQWRYPSYRNSSQWPVPCETAKNLNYETKLCECQLLAPP